jgi:hypothetical protein
MDQILFWKLLDFFLYFWNGIGRHFVLQEQNFITETPTNQKLSTIVILIFVIKMIKISVRKGGIPIEQKNV